MDFFDNLRDKLATTGKDVSDKEKEAAAVAKLKTQISLEEGKLKGLYADLGRAFYENPQDENIEAYKDSITAIKEVLAGYESELADVKGLKTCSNCGARMAKEVLFCSKCGAKNEVPEPLKEEDEAAEAVPEAKKCPVCEAEVSEDMAFCEVCGTKLDD